MLAALGEQNEAADEVGDVTERARLGPVAEDRERLGAEPTMHERGGRPPILRAHALTIRAEDARDAGVHTLLAVVGHRHRPEERLRQVVVDEQEVIMVRDGLNVLQRPGVAAVDTDHLMPQRNWIVASCEPMNPAPPVTREVATLKKRWRYAQAFNVTAVTGPTSHAVV
jgi:hypothetical protein